MTGIRTICPYCGVGCGISVTDDGLKGDADHPANFGRLCSKGAALQDTLTLPDRLLSPSIDGRETDWNEALSLVATRFGDVIRQHGPDAVAFYVSGQFLTEDYYVANKLMKGFIGSANIDTNSRLCMASSVAGHVRAFGEDVVPGCYEDVDETDLAVLVGSNTAWCHPVLYQRLMAAREQRGTKIVVIDPRRTATCETADLHLALRAGSDVALFNGLLAYLSRTRALDRRWMASHVSGYAETLNAARASAPSLEVTAAITGVPCEDLRRFYDLFAGTERAMTLYSQGVNQSVAGTDKVNAIINCHLATGRIGRAGMGPFSLTGQPNAMGGREVGGLANQLAAHMSFTPRDVERVRRFWNAPNMAARPGLKAVDMFKAVGDGRIKAIWIAATNPAVSMPNAAAVRAALDACPFVVVSDAWPTDTSRYANVVLPAATWAEKDGTVTNSERRISRQRAFRAAPGAARPDWWMFAEIARRMGWEKEFSYPNPAGIFREHAALSAFENEGTRIFDIGALSDCDDAAYDALEPVQWPCPKRRTQNSQTRLFADGRFPTPDGRARMVPVTGHSDETASHHPLKLNTGRIRDQWHTMTRTGRVPRLMTHAGEPVLAIHPRDAADHGLMPGGFARLENEQGAIVMRASITETQRQGEVFAPMHWTDQFSSAGAIDRLVHENTDAISGQPDLKGARVGVSAVTMLWTGLLLRRTAATPDLGGTVYWAKAPLQSGFAFDLAGWTELSSIIRSEAILRRLLQIPGEAELVSYSDPKKSIFRYAGLSGGRLEACLFLAPAGVELPPREHAARLLGQDLETAGRLSLLAAHTPDAASAPDKIVCACFAVGCNSLASTIRKKNLKDVSDIGSAMQAGTNCGSCIPELKKLLQEVLLEA
ncbi:MAG TPA: molybdopterin-dependent oxidoreductase [Micropepsaceae bacterium]|nr:molybdopterin-dependent oxidoreductase [Micropepsaceae bacterium]